MSYTYCHVMVWSSLMRPTCSLPSVRALLPEDAIDTMIASLPSIFFEYLMAESWLPEVLTSPESTGWPGVQTSFFRS